MRIIAGQFKGRRLMVPSGPGVRPTSDKLRETLFNILAPRIDGATVVDGYAGSGAVGLEALSRGAAHVLFVESNRRTAAVIAENVRRCDVGGRYTIECGDVAAVLRGLDPGSMFDLVLLDPPYDYQPLSDALDAAASRLDPDGMLVLERATRRNPDLPPSVERVRDVKSGDSTLTFLARRAGFGNPPKQ